MRLAARVCALAALVLAATHGFAAAVGDAHIDELSGGAWRVANAKIEMEISYTGDDLLLTRLKNASTGTDWTPLRGQASIAQLVSFRWQDNFRLTAHTITAEPNAVLLDLTFASPELEYSLFFKIYPGSLVETWSELRNTGSAVDSIDALQLGHFRLPLSAGTREVADLEDNTYGERQRVNWRPVSPGTRLDVPLIGNPPNLIQSLGHHGWIRSFFVRLNPSESLIGGVLYGHRAPTGDGYPGSLRVNDGSLEILNDGKDSETLQVGPGQTLKGLSFLFGFAGTDLSSATSAYQQLAERYLMPAAPSATSPWVEFNEYFAYDLGWDVSQLKRDADIAAELGVEVFVIDAGWWENSVKKSARVTNFDDYLVGAGGYMPDHSLRFPAGQMSFLEFSNYVHTKGMKFGLWLCPFNVDVKRNTGWDPEWLSGDGQHLCSSDQHALDWVTKQTSGLVDTYHIDFLKFDCEAPLRCTKPATLPAHQGYDELVTALRLSHPAVAIEDDLLLGHVMPSADDFDLTPERGRTVLQKDRLTEPPQYTGLYLMHEPLREAGMSAEQYQSYVNYVVRSNILGHITISSDLSHWSPGFRAVVKRHVQLYRQHRNTLAGLTQELAFDDEWDAVQFQDPRRDELMMFAFRKKKGEPKRRFQLKELQPEKIYHVTFEDSKAAYSRRGQQLMSDGIVVSVAHGPGSEIVYVR